MKVSALALDTDTGPHRVSHRMKPTLRVFLALLLGILLVWIMLAWLVDVLTLPVG